MPKTKKPCPACKNVEPSRGADEICYRCEDLLKTARLLSEQQEREFPAVRLVPEQPHWLPRIWRSEADREAQEAFLAVCRMIGKHLPKQHAKPLISKQESSWSSDTNIYAFQEGIPEMLDRLYNALTKIPDAAYREGKRDGRNLLVRIAEGELSIEDINKVTMAHA
jgi:hypothetical protein